MQSVENCPSVDLQSVGKFNVFAITTSCCRSSYKLTFFSYQLKAFIATWVAQVTVEFIQFQGWFLKPCSPTTDYRHPDSWLVVWKKLEIEVTIVYHRCGNGYYMASSSVNDGVLRKLTTYGMSKNLCAALVAQAGSNLCRAKEEVRHFRKSSAALH